MADRVRVLVCACACDVRVCLYAYACGVCVCMCVRVRVRDGASVAEVGHATPDPLVARPDRARPDRARSPTIPNRAPTRLHWQEVGVALRWHV